MAMTVNLHTHTTRCNHASGSEREYIENAIRAGLKTFGFADHAPYVFPGDYYSGYRMRWNLLGDYVNTVLALREEYKGKIDIKLGLEAEYYPDLFRATLEKLLEYPFDYLILGQHFIENELTGKYSGVRTDDETYLATYVDEICEGIRTGLFTYIAHPDLVYYEGPREVFDAHYGRLINCAKENGIPLEINLLGIRDNRHYPRDIFWELCGKLGAEVCIGCDAHSADVAYDGASYVKAMEMVERYGLKLNESPTLRPLKMIEEK